MITQGLSATVPFIFKLLSAALPFLNIYTPKITKFFENWQNTKLEMKLKELNHRLEIEKLTKIEEITQNEHIRNLELETLRLENIKETREIEAQEKVQLSTDETEREHTEHYFQLKKSDNQVKKEILKNEPNWAIHAASAVRILITIFSFIGTVLGAWFLYPYILTNVPSENLADFLLHIGYVTYEVSISCIFFFFGNSYVIAEKRKPK